jgi:hypothetical protein
VKRASRFSRRSGSLPSSPVFWKMHVTPAARMAARNSSRSAASVAQRVIDISSRKSISSASGVPAAAAAWTNSFGTSLPCTSVRR